MTTDIELRLKALQWARIHRAESWNPKDKDGDLLQAAEKVYKWLKQDEQPAPGPEPILPSWADQERRGRGVAPLQDQAATDDQSQFRSPIASDLRLAYNGDEAAIERLVARGIFYFPPSPEVKAAFAEAASQVAPATPQEDLEARRAYEASQPVESAPSAFRSELVDLIKKHRNIGPDGAIEYSKCSFMEAADRVWQTTWKSPLTRIPAEQPAAKRVPKINDVILGDGFEWLIYHTNLTGMSFWAVKLGPNENCNALFESRNEGKDRKEGGWTFKD